MLVGLVFYNSRICHPVNGKRNTSRCADRLVKARVNNRPGERITPFSLSAVDLNKRSFYPIVALNSGKKERHHRKIAAKAELRRMRVAERKCSLSFLQIT